MSDGQRVALITEKQVDAIVRRLLRAEAQVIQARHELEALKLVAPSEAVGKIRKKAEAWMTDDRAQSQPTGRHK